MQVACAYRGICVDDRPLPSSSGLSCRDCCVNLPLCHWLLLCRAYCLAKLGRYKEAIADYDAVVSLDPNNVHAYHNRGISYDKLGHFEAAIDDFNRVIQLEPANSVAYFNRGSTYDSLGMHDAAIADFGRALELDPGTQSSSPGPADAAATGWRQQQQSASPPQRSRASAGSAAIGAVRFSQQR